MPNITVANGTQEYIRVAIFKKSYKQPTLSTIAWRIVAPPIGGNTIVSIPATYEVFVNYPGPTDSKTNPYAGNQTAKLTLAQYTGSFIVTSSTTEDSRDSVANITQTFQSLVPDEIHIANRAGFGVWSHITRSGTDIFAPQVIAPGSLIIEDIRPTFYVALVSQFVYEGDRLVDEELSATSTPILVDQTATVTGSMWTGYAVQVN